MFRVLGLLFFFILLILNNAVAQCPPTNANPNFDVGGNVFGRTAPQWNQYFASKVDSSNGILCNPSFIGALLNAPIITNGATFNSGTLKNVPLPNLSTDVANKSYVDAKISGLIPQLGAIRATTTVLPDSPTYSNGSSGVGATLTAGSNTTLTVDGGVVNLNERVLVKNQSNSAQDGVYYLTQVGSGGQPWVLTRVLDFDTAAEMMLNSSFFVQSGSVNGGSNWSLATPPPIVVGSSTLMFQQNGASQVYQGDGATILLSGNVFSTKYPIGTTGNDTIIKTSSTGLLDPSIIPQTGTVTNNAALKALPVPIAGTLIFRQGFTTPGDLGGATYVYSATNCSAASGAGNDGTQVGPTSGGGCWNVININNSCRNIGLFGGVGDGVTDNTVAFNNALTVNAVNPCIIFPKGKFLFNSSLVVTLPTGVATFTLKGESQDTTQLIWPSGNGLQVNVSDSDNSFHIRDVSFITKAEGMPSFPGVSTGLFINGSGVNRYAFAALNDLTNVTFGGDSGNVSFSHYWGTAVALSGVNNVNIVNSSFTGGNIYSDGSHSTSGGDGVTLAGTPATTYAVVFNFTGCTFNNLRNGIIYGLGIQGVSIQSSNWVQGYTAIGIPPGETGLDQLAIVNSQFGYMNPYTIRVLSTLVDVLISNNLFLQISGSIAIGIGINPLTANIVGNIISGFSSPQNQVGISTVGSTVITNNTLKGLNIGINLSGSGNIIQTNKYDTSVVTKVVNSGPTGTVITGIGPAFAVVTGAINNGSGVIRLSVSSSASFVTGEYVSISGVGGVPNANVVAEITVIDANHIDLPLVLFSGAYTSGGLISSMP